MTATEIATFAAGLFALANPLIRLGPFLEMTESLTTGERRKFLATGILVMTVGWLEAIWFGSELLAILGVSTASLNAAGGTVIIALAFPMVMGSKKQQEKAEEDDFAPAQEDAS